MKKDKNDVGDIIIALLMIAILLIAIIIGIAKIILIFRLL
jgi:hypothetical protein